MENKLLLLEDVVNLGRSGDIVTVKPGYARNFLLPKKKAVVASKSALRLRARLVEERQKKAAEDRAQAEELAARIAAVSFSIEVKIDPEGHLYGSVSAADVVKLLEAEGMIIEKGQVALEHPIKTLGEHKVQLKLNEGVVGELTLTVIGDHPVDALEVVATQEAEVTEEAQDEE